ncbi:MAG: ABC transporter permease [Sterolibacteriaceae bacterium]|nr:ABC transporter permease [Sterolibacteriaceae bacterium]MBK9085310.1 ABC transporter permease [Sterolibacteriaceae bacterium]
MKTLLLNLWAYRHFIVASIKSEQIRRFARSSLGALWFILHPIAQSAIFALVLSEVLSAKLPGIANKAGYAIYLMAGMAAWGLFAEIVTRSTTIFIEYSSALKKIAFPRMCLPVIVGGSALFNHVLLLAAICIVFAFFDHWPGRAWVVLPLGIVLIAMFAFGLGVLLGVFNVFARDVGQVFGIVIQIWFWLTPIVYTIDALPKHMKWLADANPMGPLVRVYQEAMVYNALPNWASLVIPASIAAGLFILSFIVFKRASADLVDAL